jgi:endonuclease III related protein
LTRPEDHIRSYFNTLYQAWGCQHWWPAQSAFEVIVGAYLTQNTSWTNVERALSSLRKAKLLSLDGIRRTPLHQLEKLIRSAGYFRQKARRLKTFVKFLDERYAGSLTRMFAQPTVKLREELLSLNGIGPETANSILLYAGNQPVFVVDAYTRRIVERHRLAPARATYDEIRELFEQALLPLATGFGDDDVVPPAARRHSPVPQVRGPHHARSWRDGAEVREPLLRANHSRSRMVAQVRERSLRANLGKSEPQANLGISNSSHTPSRMSTTQRSPAAQVFNEMHGLIVGVGKTYCKKSQPDCERCPLKKFLPGAQ